MFLCSGVESTPISGGLITLGRVPETEAEYKTLVSSSDHSKTLKYCETIGLSFFGRLFVKAICFSSLSFFQAVFTLKSVAVTSCGFMFKLFAKSRKSEVRGLLNEARSCLLSGDQI